jgi:hypothetical protein
MFDRSIQATIFAAVCAGLVACGDKPPDCAEAKVLDRLREAIPQDAVKRITDNIEAAGNWKRPGAQQLRALLDEFGRGIKVEFKDIATDGADPTAKRSSCSVAINVNTVEGLASSQRVSYTVQRTVDSKEFLLNVPGYEFLLGAIGGSFDVHVEKARASAVVPRAPTATATAVAAPATSVAARSHTCVDSRMAAWRKDFDGRQKALIDEAERENREFRPLSLVAEEESREAALQQAQKECP